MLGISRDYKDMIEDKYIENKGIFTIEINKLQDELKQPLKAIQVLEKMDILSCYKKVIEMKVCFLEVKCSKYPDNIYVNARTAIHKGKYNRVWVNYYVGKKEDVTDNLREAAKIELAKKAIKKLLK